MIASFAADVIRLLADPGIVRSRAKIEATIGGARAYLAMQDSGRGFLQFHLGNGRAKADPEQWRDSYKNSGIGRDLQSAQEARFKFVGPVIVYAWMQAVGLVNDHTSRCFRRKAVRGFER